MPNPLFEELGGNKQTQTPQDLRGMITAYRQFRSALKGNPQQMVQQLLASGRMSQDQYQQLIQMAQQLSQYFQ